MPVGSTLLHSVQVLGFSDIGHLTLQQRLNRFLFVRPAFCLRLASGRHPEISPRGEHPCRSASTSPCRVCRGLSPPSHRLTTTMSRTVLSHYAPCPAHQTKKAAVNQRLFNSARGRIIPAAHLIACLPFLPAECRRACGKHSYQLQLQHCSNQPVAVFARGRYLSVRERFLLCRHHE